MEHNTYVHRKQADALETYWESQNEKVKMLEQFTVQGGTISSQLNQMVGDFQKSGLGALEQLMLGQNMLLSRLAEVKKETVTQNSKTIQLHQKPKVASDGKEITNPWANPAHRFPVQLSDQPAHADSGRRFRRNIHKTAVFKHHFDRPDLNQRRKNGQPFDPGG